MKDKLKYIAVYLTEEKYKKFREYCFFEDKSMSFVLNQFIDIVISKIKERKEK